MILSPTALQKLGKDAYGHAPVGTGAFTLKQWTTDSVVDLRPEPQLTGAKTPPAASFPTCRVSS